MLVVDGENRKRLSLLCRRLRGDESVRSFTKNRFEELGGISFSTWSAWERCQGGLGKESLERLVNFIDCSYQALCGYLEGFVSLEELLKPSSGDLKPDKEQDFSPEVASAWVKSLSLQDKLFVAVQGLQSFQEEHDKLLKVKAKENVELLLNLLFSSTYPANSQIQDTAQKLGVAVEDLRKLCDRVYR